MVDSCMMSCYYSLYWGSWQLVSCISVESFWTDFLTWVFREGRLCSFTSIPFSKNRCDWYLSDLSFVYCRITSIMHLLDNMNYRCAVCSVITLCTNIDDSFYYFDLKIQYYFLEQNCLWRALAFWEKKEYKV
jgi:hypothetical protein